ncbi:MAG: cell division protein FtsA [bacterium]|nr:cell division protein FtsA [bacterium]
MSKSIVTGIDIGTYNVKVVVADGSRLNERRMPLVIATGISETRGVRHGYIVNHNEVVKSIKSALSQAEKIIKSPIKKAYVSVGGIGIQSLNISASVSVTKADLEVTKLDIIKVQETAESSIPESFSMNRRIIHSIPVHYKLDGKTVLGNPEGMRGAKLEIKTHFITCLSQHLDALLQAVEEAGISEVLDVMASPIAASFVTLTKAQKIAGCVLANIGAETVSIAVFDDIIPISLEVFPIGSTDITNDIALGLKVPLEEAEQIKIGKVTGASYPRRKIEEIILARLSDIFDLIENHLKKINRNGLLPAGIIITGGGSGLSNIEDLAKAALKLPSRVANISGGDVKESIKEASWAVAYGLCILGLHADEIPGSINTNSGDIQRVLKRAYNWTKQALRQFLP